MTTTTVQSVLDEFAPDLSEPEFATWLHDELSRGPRPDTISLTGAERDTLIRFGGVPAADLEPLPPAVGVRRVAAQMLTMTAASLSVAEAARLLGIDPTRVRHRIGDKTLFGRKLGRALRLPRWQFDVDRPLPGLPTLLAALPTDVGLLEVEGLMNTEQPDLMIGDQPSTPRSWLLAGRPIDPVAAIAGNLAQW